jgi:hypothetical protein
MKNDDESYSLKKKQGKSMFLKSSRDVTIKTKTKNRPKYQTNFKFIRKDLEKAESSKKNISNSDK